MKDYLKHIVFMLALTTIFACGEKEPLSSYVPQSPDEKAIKSVLLDFQESANTKNAVKLGNLIHKKGTLMVGRERTVLTKAEYLKILPQRLEENPPFALSIPKITISGDTAEVRTYMARGNYNNLMVFDMVRENDRWYIRSWEY